MELHDYQLCDHQRHTPDRCKREAIVFVNNGDQWCKWHSPPLDPDHLRAIALLKASGLVTQT